MSDDKYLENNKDKDKDKNKNIEKSDKEDGNKNKKILEKSLKPKLKKKNSIELFNEKTVDQFIWKQS